MKKIVYTIGTLLTGGAEVFVVNLIKCLDKTQYDISIIVLDKKNNTFLEDILDELDIKIYYMNKGEGFSLKTNIGVYKILKKIKPDIIHGNIGGIIYILFYVFFNKNVRVIHTSHTVAYKEFGKFKRFILRYFYKNKKIVPVVISKENYEEYIKTYKLNNKLVETINNGVDVDKFYTERDFKNSIIRLGHMGRFEEVKNHKIIFSIYEDLLKKQSKVSLRLIGKGSLLKRYKELSKNINITFVEETKNVEDELSKIDIFIFPSIYEGMPLSLIEAMASGCVIVASNVGGIKDLVENDVNGYLYNSNDLVSFVTRISLLIKDREKMEEISNNNIKKAKQFSLEEMVNKYQKLYLKE